ncbi:MAG: hypothetical protein ACPGTO_08740 [Polaribacter sp.]
MDKEVLINYSLKALRRLPIKRINEVTNFIDFISEKYSEEKELQKDIENIVEKSNSFSFLNDEEDIYSEYDLTEKY